MSGRFVNTVKLISRELGYFYLNKMGEVFKPGDSKKEKVEKLARELQISEEEARKILKKRDLDGETE